MTDLNRYAAELGEFGDGVNGNGPPAGSAAVTSIVPATAVVGGADLTLTVNGSGFSAGYSVIVFNGGREVTTFVDATKLTTTVKPSTASGPAVVPVEVTGAAGAATFTFTATQLQKVPAQPAARGG